jgi:signal transduction histidine kinase
MPEPSAAAVATQGQAGAAPRRPAPRVKGTFTQFGSRHVGAVAVIRFVVAIWLVALGIVLCAVGQWWGASLFLLAAFVGALAYLVPRWKLAAEAPKNIQRVRELEHSRALAVDDAAVRLRRIEQDLHDGAQAQMVAVVMKLGLAREHLELAAGKAADGTVASQDLVRVADLMAGAHAAALEAIGELRDLARGIYPPVLDEGLGAAVAALASRHEIASELVFDVAERPSFAIETIAYFCVAELLTNVIKHAGARHVKIEASDRPDALTVRVIDDGCGGARLEPGGGLTGLVERVGSVDGRLHVDSPPGGPTVITVELPSRI